MAFANGGNTQTAQVFEAKLGWDKQEFMLYNTMITSAAIIGVAVGSIAAGKIITYGRRRSALISAALA